MITEFEQFSDRLLQGQILWPQVAIPVDAVAKADLTDKERKAIQAGSALLESLLASRGVAKDENRRARVARLIEYTHQRLSLQPGIPDISFATLFFDHIMEASLKPVFFPTKAPSLDRRVSALIVISLSIHCFTCSGLLSKCLIVLFRWLVDRISKHPQWLITNLHLPSLINKCSGMRY